MIYKRLRIVLFKRNQPFPAEYNIIYVYLCIIREDDTT